MKVIELSHRIIFVDDIVSIYDEYKCGEFINHTNYYIETKHGRTYVEEHDYKKVKEYLLSLNEEKEDTPKEDKEIKKLNLEFDDRFIKEHFESDSISYLSEYATLKMIYEKQCEIIDKINGE